MDILQILADFSNKMSIRIANLKVGQTTHTLDIQKLIDLIENYKYKQKIPSTTTSTGTSTTNIWLDTNLWLDTNIWTE